VGYTPENLLILVGIPLAVVALVFLLERYRPGRPYDFAPVWFLSRPEADGPQATQPTQAELAGHESARELSADGSAHTDPANVPAGATPTTGTAIPPKSAGLTGGASDRW
jgi:hypothetical protein